MNMNSTNLSWRVYGRIAGPYLPRAPVRIGGVTVGPLPRGVRGIERPAGLKATPSTDTYYVGQAGDIRVTSECYFWVDRAAGSEGEAMEAVASSEVPLLQSALTLLTDRVPYHLEVVWATGAGQNYANSPPLSTAFWEPEELSSDRLADMVADYEILSADDTARAAAGSLARAIQLSATGGDAGTREAALLNYFKVIEVIATSLPGDPAPDHEAKQQAILSELEKKLRSRKGTRKKVASVGDAEKKLSRLDNRYLSLKIEAVADQLALPREWKHAAVAFAKLRNTKLGHPGSPAEEGVIVQWFNQSGYGAPRLAREVLRAYVGSQRGGQPA